MIGAAFDIRRNLAIGPWGRQDARALDGERCAAQRSRALLGAVERVLARYGVERRGEDVVIVACSGGVDSVALAHATVEVLGGRRVVLGHVDHAVRAGSAADAAAVGEFAAQLGVPIAVERLAAGPDDEARLRLERYAALERQRVASGARYVLTAHTRDDQAETVIMGLLRSANPRSLCGIPVNRDRVLRPLLDVPRSAVRAYRERWGLPFVEDPTNPEPRYLRNRVRKELLPLLESRYRPQLKRRLSILARRMVALTADSGEKRPESAEDSRSAGGPGSGGGAWLHGRRWLKMERRPWRGDAPPDGRDEVVFDAAVVSTPRIRLIRPGDRIKPFGMQGHRKVRDLLREAGVAPSDRAVVPVVVDAADAVIWVPGVARSALGPISGTTREVWWFSIGQDHELQARESRATLDGATTGKT